MTKVSKLVAPEFKMFNPFHPHQFHQRVSVKTRHGEQSTFETWFVNCPESGLTDDLLNAFLVADLGAGEDLDSTGLGDGEYWLNDGEGCISADVMDNGAVYANDDPELINYRTYAPDYFGCSFYAEAGIESEAQLFAMAMIEAMPRGVGQYFAIYPEKLYAEEDCSVLQSRQSDWNVAVNFACNKIYHHDLVDNSDHQDEVADMADKLVIEYYRKKHGL